MRIAITGGTGFVGRHLARALVAGGHDVVLLARGVDQRDQSVRQLARCEFISCGVDDPDRLSAALAGCDAVAHCAGINREIGIQTYAWVHLQGTRNVVEAARRAGVKKIVMLSFLRSRAGCRSGYHESKWAAEEIVRESGIDHTIIKAGVIYGRGDHMLDHLSHALYTFTVFGLVGMKDQKVAPLAVEDLVGVIGAALVEGKWPRATVAMIGPEEMTLGEAVRRVARVVGKRPMYVRLPVWVHYGLAWVCEQVMKVPLVSVAQVRILSEGVVEVAPGAREVTEKLRGTVGFTEEQIQKGLPERGGFGVRDCRCFRMA
jgi:nucleoside-diphosphate-sugar epimerase